MMAVQLRHDQRLYALSVWTNGVARQHMNFGGPLFNLLMADEILMRIRVAERFHVAF